MTTNKDLYKLGQKEQIQQTKEALISTIAAKHAVQVTYFQEAIFGNRLNARPLANLEQFIATTADHVAIEAVPHQSETLF